MGPEVLCDPLLQDRLTARAVRFSKICVEVVLVISEDRQSRCFCTATVGMVTITITVVIVCCLDLSLPLVFQFQFSHALYVSQARSQGGGGVGGVVRPPPVAHPKDFVPPFSNFVPPFSNFVPPFSNFVPPFSNFVPPFSNFVPPFSNFVPPFSNFVPPLEYVDDVTRAMSKGGGGACECPRVGAFFKLMTSRGQCPRGGGCAWCSTHPSSDPPHLAGWLRACEPFHFLCLGVVDPISFVLDPFSFVYTEK